MKRALSISREQSYADWYLEVIKAADLAEHSPARGCMILKPWGFAIWELIQKKMDAKIKEEGHEGVYFPIFIPLSFFEKEAEHIEGFAKECAVVTHHRLEKDEKGRLIPAGELEEPYIVRPTSEMIIGEAFSRWIQSYRDLPLKVNQWANIVRWEMRTRLFLRTCEILWHEGHTAHATAEEAETHAQKMLEAYVEIMTHCLALAPTAGVKSQRETFPGAVHTLTVEMMMQDKKALQGGTSHFLGQNFSKSCDILFQDEEGKRVHAWTTSFGATTRLVGALIMSHSDDDGLVLPPCVAPKQVIILPIVKEENRKEILTYCRELQKKISQQTFQGERIRVYIDDRDLRGGEKNWSWVKKGVPIRIEVGAKEQEKQLLSVLFRIEDPRKKEVYSEQEFIEKLSSILETIQEKMQKKVENFQRENLQEIFSEKEFYEFFQNEKNPGFALCYYSEEANLEEKIQKDLNVTLRCFPIAETQKGKCIFTQKEARKAIFAKAY